MVSTGLHMTELTTKWKGLYPEVDISVFTAESSRENTASKIKKVELYEGVEINRVKNIGKHHGSLFQRVLFSFGFIFKALFFLMKNRKKYDALLITTNPPFLGILILIIKYSLGIPYVIIAYDIYPQILDRMGILKKTNIVYKFWKWLNINVYNKSAKIISIGDDMTEVIVNEMCVKDRNKIQLIHNWSDKQKVFPVEKRNNSFIREHNISDKKILLYSGTLGTTHNIEDILDAAKELKDRHEILFLFIGAGAKVSFVKDYIKNSGNSNVMLLPFQPLETLCETLSSASLSFVCLDNSFTGLSVPSKSYGILASKVPILGMMSDDSEISQMIERYNCGIVWNSGKNVKLSSLIVDLLTHDERLNIMKENAYTLFLENFEIEISVKKYNNLLRSILS
jgi:glycosyltransferase involved in cell wall biosynthesis